MKKQKNSAKKEIKNAKKKNVKKNKQSLKKQLEERECKAVAVLLGVRGL